MHIFTYTIALEGILYRKEHWGNMESVLVDLVVLGVMFFPILLAAAIISKNDPTNNWNEEA